MYSSRKQKTKASFPVQTDRDFGKQKDKKGTKFECTY